MTLPTMPLADATGLIRQFDLIPNFDGSYTSTVSLEGTRATFGAVSLGLVPVAAGATDFLTISAGAKTVKLARLRISGTAGTLITVPVSLIRRPTPTVIGSATLATSTALPVAAPYDTADGASTATLAAYTTANPTLGGAGQLLGTQTVTLGTTAAEVVVGALDWNFAQIPGARFPTLRGGSTQQLVLNLNSTAISAPLVNVELTWIEDFT